MSYPVTLIGGTDELQLRPDGRVYRPGDRIDDLSDEQRASLQSSGVRFSVAQEGTKGAPAARVASVAPTPEADVRAVADLEAADARADAADEQMPAPKASSKRGGD